MCRNISENFIKKLYELEQDKTISPIVRDPNLVEYELTQYGRALENVII
ncbi:winged helix-turn-helix transcriptional regulator [Flavobacterium sp. XS2P39]